MVEWRKAKPYKIVCAGVVGTFPCCSRCDLWVSRQRQWDMFMGSIPVCQYVGKFGAE